MLSLEAGCGPRVGFSAGGPCRREQASTPDSLAEGTIHLARLPVAPSSPLEGRRMASAISGGPKLGRGSPI